VQPEPIQAAPPPPKPIKHAERGPAPKPRPAALPTAPRSPAPIAGEGKRSEAAGALPAPTPTPVPEERAGAQPEQDGTSTGTGVLRVNSRPWSRVYVDGRLLGSTPQTKLVLGAGRHTVTLVNPDFGFERVLTVQIKPGETLTKIVDFSAPQQ
jgi:hypothetical protein